MQTLLQPALPSVSVIEIKFNNLLILSPVVTSCDKYAVACQMLKDLFTARLSVKEQKMSSLYLFLEPESLFLPVGAQSLDLPVFHLQF